DLMFILHAKNLQYITAISNLLTTYAIFEACQASTIQEVQQQENVSWENPKGASNEKGAMVDDIDLNIENSHVQASKLKRGNSSMEAIAGMSLGGIRRIVVHYCVLWKYPSMAKLT
nr:hypothetical protein [Tanacetum cinerariifolium]